MACSMRQYECRSLPVGSPHIHASVWMLRLDVIASTTAMNQNAARSSGLVSGGIPAPSCSPILMGGEYAFA